MNSILDNHNFYWFLVIIIGVVGMIVQGRLQAVFNKYSKIMFHGGLTGREVAEKMLRDNGVHDVTVTSTKGHLTDNYNPRTKTVNLSESVYNSNSVSAAAVAAHECGHAIQDATEYAPLKMRSALVPVISASSQWSTWVVLIGAVIAGVTGNVILLWIGIGMIALAAVFSIITLPVEYNASSRALVWLGSSNTLSQEEVAQAKVPLKWAARTYLVSALGAIAILLYWVAVAGRRN